ncbi:class I SAM-dependent methyltransferase [Nocardia vinacea]|uniref:class I SAM-dependent methyltransferase n=1 Tax=Nocardia vinacea TaxID=96468 RepID=UPI002E16226A|nr:class I SAM-dependent methyltransferase [Nocardia vinacea]
MPTLPPERTSSDQRESHQARELAESFGSDPERYDRARPSYPAAMVDAIVAASPGPEIVDVGIGTGIAARQFRAAGCRVLGVEVDARMGEWARKHGFEVEVSAFEAWDPAGRIFDAVIAGQTWHWVDPVAGAAKAAEVLRPGGRLAVFWNAGQPPTDLAQAFAAVYQRVVPDSLAARWAAGPRTAYSAPHAKVTEGIRAAGGFGEPEQWTFDWERTYTRDEWLDQLPTTGGHAQFSSATQKEVLAGIGSAIDAAGGSFTVRFTTTVVTALRI